MVIVGISQKCESFSHIRRRRSAALTFVDSCHQAISRCFWWARMPWNLNVLPFPLRKNHALFFPNKFHRSIFSVIYPRDKSLLSVSSWISSFLRLADDPHRFRATFSCIGTNSIVSLFCWYFFSVWVFFYCSYPENLCAWSCLCLSMTLI